MIAYLKFKFAPKNRQQSTMPAGSGLNAAEEFKAPAPINRRKVLLHVSDDASSAEQKPESNNAVTGDPELT